MLDRGGEDEATCRIRVAGNLAMKVLRQLTWRRERQTWCLRPSGTPFFGAKVDE